MGHFSIGPLAKQLANGWLRRNSLAFSVFHYAAPSHWPVGQPEWGGGFRFPSLSLWKRTKDGGGISSLFNLSKMPLGSVKANLTVLPDFLAADGSRLNGMLDILHRITQESGKDPIMLEYHAAYYKIEDGWYMARVLDFPGTISQGKTLKSARVMIRDALKLMAECTLEMGQPLPPPNPRARDRKAAHIEKIPLKITARVGAVA